MEKTRTVVVKLVISNKTNKIKSVTVGEKKVKRSKLSVDSMVYWEYSDPQYGLSIDQIWGD